MRDGDCGAGVVVAIVADIALLTRDVSRYRSYFPTVTLLAPEEN